MSRMLTALLLTLGIALADSGHRPAVHIRQRAELEARLRADARAIPLYRQGLQTVVAFVKSQPALCAPARGDQPGLLRRDQKEVLWNAWQRFLDYSVALRSLERYHSGRRLLPKDLKEDSLLMGYAAFLAQYRAALEWIECVESNPEMDKVLNDRVPEIRLPAGSYAQLKLRFLNVATATEFAAYAVLRQTLKKEQLPAIGTLIDEDSAAIWRMGKGKGEWMTVRNAWKILENAAGDSWLPVQAGVSEWMGDTRIRRAGQSLITAQQVRALQPRLEPGDVLLERREWYLSNIGLPGFWSHAALYVGTAGERRNYFADKDVRVWIQKQGIADGEIETLLRTRYPAKYAASLKSDTRQHPFRVIEAMSEGVCFTALEHSADCDSLAVLRPRLPKWEKARSMVRAFHYAGRPYDFNFDFATDSELVCTELIYRSYEPTADSRGLRLPLVEVLGRKVTPANEIARQCSMQSGTAGRQLDLILFLDGQERQRRSIEASPADFFASWRRPKWHILLQKHPDAGRR